MLCPIEDQSWGVGGVGGVAAAATAVVEAGEVRHWECCVKRVEASESQTKEAAATFSTPPRADCPSYGATRKGEKKPNTKTSSTGKRDPPPLAFGPDTGDRNTYFWVAPLYCFFFTGGASAGRVSCLAKWLHFFRHLSRLLAGFRSSVFLDG